MWKFLLVSGLLFNSVSLFAQFESFEASQNGHMKTDALIVFHKDKIYFEKYFRGYNQDRKHLSWSMAKTISALLIAIAREQGILNFNDPLKKRIKGFKGTATILDTLQMSSGVAFREEYSGIPVNADVTKMLYLEGQSKGMGQYMSSLPLRKEKPGEHFYYSSGDTNLLMEYLKNSLPKDKYANFPWDNLFNPLGIDVTLERDSQKTFVGSSYMYMTARDFLEVGKLIANYGRVGERQIVSQDIIKLMQQVAPGVKKMAIKKASRNRAYSIQATTNRGIKSRGHRPQYEDLPLDTILLLGFQGQLIAVSPQEKLIILRLAMDKGSAFDKARFFTEVKKYLNEKGVQYSTARSSFSNEYKQWKPVKESFDESSNFSVWDLFKAPDLLVSYGSKEFCSCFFITGRGERWCREDLDQTLPYVPSLFVDNAKKTVTAKTLSGLKQRTAKFYGKRYGCSLISK